MRPTGDGVGFPLYQKYWTGPTQIDSQYGPDRFDLFMVESIMWSLYNSTGGAVNYLGGNWLKNRPCSISTSGCPLRVAATWSEGLV